MFSVRLCKVPTYRWLISFTVAAIALAGSGTIVTFPLTW